MVKIEKVSKNLQLVAWILLPWGLFFFEAMASILVIVFSLPLLLYGRSLSPKKAGPYVWPFLLIYAILLVSGFWSADTTRWLSLLRVNLPYVVLPVAYMLWPENLLQHRRLIQRQFIWAGAVLSLYLAGYLVMHLEEVLIRIGEGGFFPVPVHHVRTSLFLAVGAMFCLEELGNRMWTSRGFGLYAGIMFLLMLGLHILTVRTGLVLFYTGTLLTVVINKNFYGKKGVLVFLGLLSFIVAAAFFIPTVGEKWSYFLADRLNYDSASWWFYSDAVRWKSTIIGWEVFRDAPWWGVGMGDVLEELHMRFFVEDGIRIWEYPHNLWVTFMAGSGLIGFGAFNLGLFGVYKTFYRSTPAVYIVIFWLFMVSCLVENTLLTSLGGIAFVVLSLLATDAIGGGSEDSVDVDVCPR